MPDVLAIANKRLESLKAEVAKIEQFLAFAAELTAQSAPGAAAAATGATAASATPAREAAAPGTPAGAPVNTGGFRLRERSPAEDGHEDLSKLMRG